MTLYEIKGNYISLLQAIENGEIPEEAIKDTLAAVDGEFAEKADNIACFMKSQQAEVAAIKQEIDTLTERAKSKTNKTQRLSEYLLDAMLLLEKDKLETARSVLKVAVNPPHVVITDEAILYTLRPDLFTTPAPQPNKTAIKAVLNDGGNIVGAELQQGYRLGVK